MDESNDFFMTAPVICMSRDESFKDTIVSQSDHETILDGTRADKLISSSRSNLLKEEPEVWDPSQAET